MPNRILREAILDSEAVNALTPQAEVFYRRLMSVVDDFGRFDARPAVLRGRLYPLQLDRVREADLDRWIAECVKASLIRLYTVGSGQYILFHKLGEPRAKSSKFPAPPSDDCACAQTRAYVPDSYSPAPIALRLSDSGGGVGGNGLHFPKEIDTPEFREAWAEFQSHCGEKGNPVNPKRRSALFREFVAWGVPDAISGLRQSIANGWNAVVRPKKAGAPASRGRRERGSILREGLDRADG